MGGRRASELIRTETTEEKRNDKISMRGQGLNSRVDITGVYTGRKLTRTPLTQSVGKYLNSCRDDVTIGAWLPISVYQGRL
jgi:hypothetical protein